jgi:spore germination cell wall hydrolase CwlJ-like protein
MTSMAELETMTRTIWAEARGEPSAGQLAVGWVIQNRVKDNRFPDGYAEVCLQPMQFSCWNTGTPSIPEVRLYEPAWVLALETALAVMTRKVDDPTKGATHYLNIDETRKLRRNHDLPDWVSSLKVTAMIGRHTFLRAY